MVIGLEKTGYTGSSSSDGATITDVVESGALLLFQLPPSSPSSLLLPPVQRVICSFLK